MLYMCALWLVTGLACSGVWSDDGISHCSASLHKEATKYTHLHSHKLSINSYILLTFCTHILLTHFHSVFDHHTNQMKIKLPLPYHHHQHGRRVPIVIESPTHHHHRHPNHYTSKELVYLLILICTKNIRVKSGKAMPWHAIPTS